MTCVCAEPLSVLSLRRTPGPLRSSSGMNSTPAFSRARGAADKRGILQDGEAKVRIQPLDCLAGGEFAAIEQTAFSLRVASIQQER